jgi:hypothetical protein
LANGEIQCGLFSQTGLSGFAGRLAFYIFMQLPTSDGQNLDDVFVYGLQIFGLLLIFIRAVRDSERPGRRNLEILFGIRLRYKVWLYG